MALTFISNISEELKPKITVIGVGGAGGNAINNMIETNLIGVEFVVANTDAQALAMSHAKCKIQLGAQLTRGLGAGSKPETGRAAAEESISELESIINRSTMVFITAGMGGGTGTGAAPIIAKIAKDLNILTVAVVTKPLQCEGGNRMKIAEAGINELSQYVDSLIIIPNQNLFRLATECTTLLDALKMADQVLNAGVRSVTDLIMTPGLINADYKDIHSVMSGMGRAMMGSGEASGEKRATAAAEMAISNPLLDDSSIKGAKSALINITAGDDLTLFEVDEAINRIREEIDPDALLKFGSTYDTNMTGRVRVAVIATGMNSHNSSEYTKNGFSGISQRVSQTAPIVERDSSAEQRMSSLARNHSPFPQDEHAPSDITRTAYTPPSRFAAEPLPSPIASQVDPIESKKAPPLAPNNSSLFDNLNVDTFGRQYYTIVDDEMARGVYRKPVSLDVAMKASLVDPAGSHGSHFRAPKAVKQDDHKLNSFFERLNQDKPTPPDTVTNEQTAIERDKVKEAPNLHKASKTLDLLSNSEDDLEIPAFLRRQANS